MTTKPTSRQYYRDTIVAIHSEQRSNQWLLLPFWLQRLLIIANKRAGFGYRMPRWLNAEAVASHYSDLMHLAECLDERRFTPMP